MTAAGESIRDFCGLAEEYCSFVADNAISKDLIPELMVKLAGLYISAIHLPDAQPETACPSEDIREAFAVKLSEDICSAYWETADPY